MRFLDVLSRMYLRQKIQVVGKGLEEPAVNYRVVMWGSDLMLDVAQLKNVEVGAVESVDWFDEEVDRNHWCTEWEEKVSS